MPSTIAVSTSPPARRKTDASWYSGDSKQATPLLEGREFDYDVPLEVLRSRHDLVATAAREDFTAIAADDLRHAVRVLLVRRRIGDFRAGDPIRRHGGGG